MVLCFPLFLHIICRIVLTQNSHLYTLPKEKRTKHYKDTIQNKDKVQFKGKYQSAYAKLEWAWHDPLRL
jgi:hypothetical protein